MTRQLTNKNSRLTDAGMIEYDVFLHFDANGNVRMARTTDGKGKAGERTAQVTFEIPQAAFDIPTFRATIALGEGALLTGGSAEVVQRMETALEGVPMELTIVEPPTQSEMTRPRRRSRSRDIGDSGS